MKILTSRIMIFAYLCAWGLGAASEVHANSDWNQDDRRSTRSSGGSFWGRSSSGSNRHPSTAEISQALYGTDPSQYDASEGGDASEVDAKTG